jgi:hypothetical protein
MSLLMEMDNQDVVIAGLRRELAHVHEQLRVEHTMTLDYRARYEACEKQRASLEKKLNTARRKLQTKSGQAARRATDPGDAILDWLQEQDTEDEQDEALQV